MDDCQQQRLQTASNVSIIPSRWQINIDLVNQLVASQNVVITILADEGAGKTTFLETLTHHLKSGIVPLFVQATPPFNRHKCLEPFRPFLDIKGELSIGAIIAHCRQHKKEVLWIIDDAHHLPIQFVDELLSHMQLQEAPFYFHICLASNYSLFQSLQKLVSQIYPDLVHTLELGILAPEETTQPAPTPQQPAYQNPSSMPTHTLLRTSIIGVLFVCLIGLGYLFSQPLLQSSSNARLLNQLFSRALKSDNKVLPRIETVMHSEIPPFSKGATKRFVQVVQLHQSELFSIAGHPTEAVFEPVIDRVIVIPKPVLRATKALKKQPVNADQTALYTIQLLGGHDRHVLERYAAIHRVRDKTTVMQTIKEGRVWYVLAYGHYHAHHEAQQAVDALPETLSKNKPWVRPLGQLKERA